MCKDFKMNINNLPTDCLIIILKKLPLQGQIRLRLVCVHWKSVIELLCDQKRSLKLFGSFENVRYYAGDLITNGLDDDADLTLKKIGFDDDLIVNVAYFETEVCDFLCSLFPNIEKLVIYFGFVYPFTHVPYMLTQWSRLSNLSLCGNFYPIDMDLISQICQAINLLPSLVSLNILAANFFCVYNFDMVFNLKMPQVLAKLKVLSLYNYSDNIFSVLKQLSLNCEKLILNQVDLSTEQLINIHKSNFNLANVKHFQITGLEMNKIEHLIEFMCDQFGELECLHIYFCRYPMSKFNFALFSQIGRLTCLTKLRISLKYDEITNDESFDRLPQILTLKELNLCLVDTFKEDLNGERFCFILSRIFPNVEKFVIYNDNSDATVLNDIQKNIYQFRHLRQYRLYSKEDEFEYLGRHVEKAKKEDVRIDMENIIKNKSTKRQAKTRESIDLRWQSDEF